MSDLLVDNARTDHLGLFPKLGIDGTTADKILQILDARTQSTFYETRPGVSK